MNWWVLAAMLAYGFVCFMLGGTLATRGVHAKWKMSNDSLRGAMEVYQEATGRDQVPASAVYAVLDEQDAIWKGKK